MDHKIPFEEIAIPEALVKNGMQWRPAGDKGGRTLHTNGQFRAQQLGFTAGSKLEGHVSRTDNAPYILSGELRFTFGDEQRTVELGTHDRMGYDRNVPHSIEAVEDTVALLVR
jgi:quercetin dioxygenase-like cupin family protein